MFKGEFRLFVRCSFFYYGGLSSVLPLQKGSCTLEKYVAGTMKMILLHSVDITKGQGN